MHFTSTLLSLFYLLDSITFSRFEDTWKNISSYKYFCCQVLFYVTAFPVDLAAPRAMSSFASYLIPGWVTGCSVVLKHYESNL